MRQHSAIRQNYEQHLACDMQANTLRQTSAGTKGLVRQQQRIEVND